MELGFWSLSEINEHLKKYSKQPIRKPEYKRHDDELWVGWIVSKFLEDRNNKEYLLGLPFKEKSNQATLNSISKIKTIVEDDTLDVAIIEKDAISEGKKIDWAKLYRIQIKRYNEQNPSTDGCVAFMKKKLDHYAPDKNLNLVFLIETGFEVDIAKMKEFTSGYIFNFASLWFVGYYLNQKLDPFLMPIFPQFTGIMWKLSK